MWSVPRRDRLGRPVNGGLLLQRKDGFGRLDVSLQVNNKARRFLVHRLVLEAFVGSCPAGMVCRHLDGNPANNHINTLKWGTQSENAKDAVKHGTCALLGSKVPRAKGEKQHSSKFSELEVGWIRYLRKAGVLLRDLTEYYGGTQSSISAICRRKVWKHVY